MEISLIFYGEPETEDGNPISLTNEAMMKDDFYSYKNLENIMLSGITLKEQEKHNITHNDVSCFLPMEFKELEKTKLEFHYLGYYLRWIPRKIIITP